MPIIDPGIVAVGFFCLAFLVFLTVAVPTVVRDIFMLRIFSHPNANFITALLVVCISFIVLLLAFNFVYFFIYLITNI